MNPNPISRRNFLTVAGTAAAGLAAQATIGTAFAALADGETTPEKKKYPIGLELYSVRNELARDLPNTLRTVAKMGYEVVEFYAPYFDWKIPYAKDVRTLMDDLGLRCFSTHNNFASFTPGGTMDKAIELNQILGTRFLILASEPGGIKGTEGCKKLCEQLTTAVCPPAFTTTEQSGPNWMATSASWILLPRTRPRNLRCNSMSAPA